MHIGIVRDRLVERRVYLVYVIGLDWIGWARYAATSHGGCRLADVASTIGLVRAARIRTVGGCAP